MQTSVSLYLRVLIFKFLSVNVSPLQHLRPINGAQAAGKEALPKMNIESMEDDALHALY